MSQAHFSDGHLSIIILIPCSFQSEVINVRNWAGSSGVGVDLNYFLINLSQETGSVMQIMMHGFLNCNYKISKNGIATKTRSQKREVEHKKTCIPGTCTDN